MRVREGPVSFRRGGKEGELCRVLSFRSAGFPELGRPDELGSMFFVQVESVFEQVVLRLLV